MHIHACIRNLRLFSIYHRDWISSLLFINYLFVSTTISIAWNPLLSALNCHINSKSTDEIHPQIKSWFAILQITTQFRSLKKIERSRNFHSLHDVVDHLLNHVLFYIFRFGKMRIFNKNLKSLEQSSFCIHHFN